MSSQEATSDGGEIAIRLGWRRRCAASAASHSFLAWGDDAPQRVPRNRRSGTRSGCRPETDASAPAPGSVIQRRCALRCLSSPCLGVLRRSPSLGVDVLGCVRWRCLGGQPGECAHGDCPESLDAQRHCGEVGAGWRQLVQAGQVLDDGDARGEQQGVRGPFAVCDVVDVDRVDADERRGVAGEPGCAVPGEEVRALGVLRVPNRASSPVWSSTAFPRTSAAARAPAVISRRRVPVTRMTTAGRSAVRASGMAARSGPSAKRWRGASR